MIIITLLTNTGPWCGSGGSNSACHSTPDVDDNDDDDKEIKKTSNNKRISMVMARLFNYNFYLFFLLVGWFTFLHVNKWLHD